MEKKLYLAAKASIKNSYAPYSNFKVCAAVLLSDGSIITGNNVENSSYGLTVCAERNALFQAYNKGYRKDDVKALLIYTPTLDVFPYPCGACRQVMNELMNGNAPVYVSNDTEEIKEFSVDSLLPNSFSGDCLK